MAIQIPLKNGSDATVDDQDADWALQWSWTNLRGYAVRYETSGGKTVQIRMHRELAVRWGWQIAGLDIDHISLDKSDNRRCNLRVATFSQNQWNRPKLRNNSSGVKGVHWSTKAKRWIAQIRVHGKRQHLGSYLSREDAAQAYARASSTYHGEFGRTNIDDVTVSNDDARHRSH